MRCAVVTFLLCAALISKNRAAPTKDSAPDPEISSLLKVVIDKKLSSTDPQHIEACLSDEVKQYTLKIVTLHMAMLCFMESTYIAENGIVDVNYEDWQAYLSEIYTEAKQKAMAENNHAEVDKFVHNETQVKTIPNFLQALFKSKDHTEGAIVAAGERLLNHTKAVVEEAKVILEREKADKNIQTPADEISRDELEKGTIKPGNAVILQMKEHIKSLKNSPSQNVATKKTNVSVLDAISELEIAEAKAFNRCVIQPKLQKALKDGSAVIVPGVGVIRNGPKGSGHRH
ncbi:hypothetical protein DdX_18222 [Ditylenchus destructor]|uniref:Uncharacterized protein n=1 Tax=Ditylenchus destructor TaxID=166010 RepID=A0AAD4MK97_9BILA|nr:hypothetical protein DdX_18222 [Ditylenchus destructor]